MGWFMLPMRGKKLWGLPLKHLLDANVLLAASKGMKFATLDTSIKHEAVEIIK